MSTDQPELSSFGADDTPALHEETLDGVGAAYTADDTAAASAAQQAPENRCLNCGASIDSKTARVVGDNNGCVRACVECRDDVLDDENYERGNFSGTVAVVHHLRSMERGGLIDHNGGGRR